MSPAAGFLMARARTLLPPADGGQQYVWEELDLLKSAVLRAAPIEPKRARSAGIVSGATFQELTEAFVRVVIPKVWEREGSRISCVAEKLSIPPMKVRRILHSMGGLK
jgi:hypothetical protein